MATPIYVENKEHTGAHPFGTQFAEGFEKGFDERQAEKAKEEQRKLFTEFMQIYNAAKTKEEVMTAAANPRYSVLFDEISDYQALGKLMEDKFKAGELKEFKFRHPELGEQSVMVPEEKLPDPTQPGSLEEFFSSIGAPPGSSIYGPEKQQKKEEFFSDPLGTNTLGYFVPGTEPPSAYSSAEVKNIQEKMRQETAARAAGAGAGKQETVAGGGDVERAIALLNQQGIAEPSPTQIRGAMLTLDQLNQAERSLEKFEELRATVTSKFEVRDSDRLQLARSLLYPLVLQGKRPDEAAKIASHVSENLIPPSTLEGTPQPNVEIMPSTAASLKPGTAYQDSQGRRYVYAGRSPEGRQQWIPLDYQEGEIEIPQEVPGGGSRIRRPRHVR